MTIRRLLGTLLALAVALAAALFGITVLQGATASERTDAEHARVTSFALSDQMRQSSNDLTRMVRLYVTTGDERYRRYYDEILAIRRGDAPRPVDYDSSYWDRVLADGKEGRTGPARSLHMPDSVTGEPPDAELLEGPRIRSPEGASRPRVPIARHCTDSLPRHEESKPPVSST